MLEVLATFQLKEVPELVTWIDGDRFIIATGTKVAVYDRHNSASPTAELDFDSNIIQICSTVSNYALLVDVSNKMHLVSYSGVLLCSYPLKRTDRAIHSYSYAKAQTIDFCIVFNTGEVLEIGDVAFELTTLDPPSLAASLKKLTFGRHQIESEIRKITLCAQGGGNRLSALYVDQSGSLKLIPNMSLEVTPVCGSVNVIDFILLPVENHVLVLRTGGRIDLVDFSNDSLVVVASQPQPWKASLRVVSHRVFRKDSSWVCSALCRGDPDDSDSSIVVLFGETEGGAFVLPCGLVDTPKALVSHSGGRLMGSPSAGARGQIELLRIKESVVARSIVSSDGSTLLSALTGAAVSSDETITRLLDCVATVEELVGSMFALATTRPCVALPNETLAALVAASKRFPQRHVADTLQAIVTASKCGSLDSFSAILSDPGEAFCAFLRSGSLQAASSVLDRHLSRCFPVPVAAAVGMIGSDASPADLTSWLEREVQPRVAAGAVPVDSLREVCTLTLTRAVALEATTSSPFDAALVAGIAFKMASCGVDSAGALASVVEDCRSLVEVLDLLITVLVQWGRKVSLDEFRAKQLRGLVLQVLDEAELEGLETYIGSKMRPLVSRSTVLCLDQVLREWVDATVSSTVFSEDDDDSYAVFVKAIAVVRSIVDPQLQARVLLLLLQLPSTSSHVDQSVAQAELIALAKQLQGSIRGSTDEALTEAIRLFELKVIAAKYGVLKFNIRNQAQVRAVVYVIINRAKDGTAIDDALAFTKSWSSAYMNSSDVISRAICSKALAVEVSCTERGDLLRSIAQRIEGMSSQAAPLMDDIVNSLVALIDSSFPRDSQSIIGELRDSSSKSLIETLTQSLIVVVSVFIDVLAKHQTSQTSSIPASSLVTVELLAKLKAMVLLQTEHGIFLSLRSLSTSSDCRLTAALMAKKLGARLLEDAEHGKPFQSPLTSSIRRACAILRTSTPSLLHSIVKEVLPQGSAPALRLSLDIAGLLGAELSSSEYSGQDSTIIAELSRSLCAAAATFTSFEDKISPFKTTHHVLRTFLESCSADALGTNLDLFSAADLVLAISCRVDVLLSDSRVQHRGGFRIADNYDRDGILLKFENILYPVLRYSLQETTRRNGSRSRVADSDDVEALVNALQRSDHHMLSIRVVLSSWCAGPSKAQLLRVSLLALSRKVLQAREVDSLLAVASLSSLANEHVVRELKAILPTIQNDHSRLRCVAAVGGELSRILAREDMLVVFETMQTNCRWIHLLQSKGVKLDPRAFQSTDSGARDAYLRSIIPEVLLRSGMDLELAHEFCRDFKIESDAASLTYVEQSFLAPSGDKPIDATWRTNIRQVSAAADEPALTALLRSVLVKVHAVDYEKIGFVCCWLIELLADDTTTVQMKSNSSASGSSPTTVVTGTFDSEIKAYNRYLDVLHVVQDVSVPGISSPLVGNTATFGVFQNRIPLWQLLEDPVTMLERVVSMAPQTALHLVSLCPILQLDKDHLVVRRFRAVYTSDMRPKLSASAIDYATMFSALVDELQLVDKKVAKLEALKWVSDLEKSSTPSWAVFVLERVAESMKTVCLGNELVELKELVASELVKCKCEVILRGMLRIKKGDRIPAEFSSKLSDPAALAGALLQVSPERAWCVFLSDLHSAGNAPLSSSELQRIAFTKGVAGLLNDMAVGVKHIWDEQGQGGIVDESGGESPEQCRRQLLLSLMTRKATADQEEESLDWGTLAPESILLASPFEKRCIEELFIAFSIAALVASSTTTEAKDSYVRHLLAVAHGSDTKFAASSRYRAAQALFLMREESSAQSIEASRDYLYCLAAIQSVRLSCSTGLLTDAIAGIDDMTPQILTWLHDDGHHSDVPEVCRDVLLLTRVRSAETWTRLVGAMLQYGQAQGVWHTVAALCSDDLFSSVCDAFLPELLKMMGGRMAEAVERIEQADTSSTASGSGTEAHLFVAALTPHTDSKARGKKGTVSPEVLELELLRTAAVWSRLCSLDALQYGSQLDVSEIRACWRRLLDIVLMSSMSAASSTGQRRMRTQTVTCVLEMMQPHLLPSSSLSRHDGEKSFVEDCLSALNVARQGQHGPVHDGVLFDILCRMIEQYHNTPITAILTLLRTDSDFSTWLLQCLASMWNSTAARRRGSAALLKVLVQESASASLVNVSLKDDDKVSLAAAVRLVLGAESKW